MSRRVRRTQAERRLESEHALLQAAIDVIVSEGMAGVTFEALGRAGGFSRGLASTRFGSKAGLIEAVLKNLHERQQAMLEEHGFDDLPGLDAVLGYVGTCLRDMAHNKEAQAYFMLLSSSVAETNELRTAFAATHEVVRQRLEGWIEKGQAEGTIRREEKAGALALMVGCLMFGMSMQLLVDPRVDFEALRRSSLALLRQSLAATTTDDRKGARAQS